MTSEISIFRGEYFFLSNFFPAPICFEGLSYATAEHAYQAAKLLSTNERRMFTTFSSPYRAKRLGRGVAVRDGWDDIKVFMMYRILKQKFSSTSPLAAKLLQTGNANLIEGNTWGDTFWGVCRGRGENQFGRLLMRVREEVKNVHA